MISLRVLNVDVVPPRADQLLHSERHSVAIYVIREVQAIFESFRPTVVFHLASIVDLRSVPDPLAEEVNVKGTMNLLKESSRSKSCRRFSYTFNDAVGGHFGIQTQMNPHHTLNPSTCTRRVKVKGATGFSRKQSSKSLYRVLETGTSLARDLLPRY